MSNLALWSRPAWDTDRWLRDFFGPAATDGLEQAEPTSGFNPAAEIVKDGDDAVVRLELPGVDVEKDVNVEVDKGRLVIHGEHRDEHAEEQGRAHPAGDPLRIVPPVVPAAGARHQRGHLGLVRRRRADRAGHRRLRGRSGATHRHHQVARCRRSGGAMAPPDRCVTASGPAARWPGPTARTGRTARS